MPTQLDPQVVALAKSIRKVESNDDFTARGKSGEFGAYQYTPETWQARASKYGINVPLEQATPQQQNEVQYRWMKEKKDQGYNIGQIASMHNAGEGNPDAYLNGNKGVNSHGVAYDTGLYAQRVAQAYQQMKPQQMQGAVAGYQPPTPPLAPVEEPQGAQQPDKSPLRKGVEFAFPLVTDAIDLFQGKNTKTPGQILGDTALTAAWAIPGLGAGGAVGKALIPRLLANAAVRGGAIGYGTGVASDLSQGKSLGEALTPTVGKAISTAVGAGTGGLLRNFGTGAGGLESSVARDITRILAPTTKVNKKIVQEIAPDLAAKSPIALTKQGLLTKYQALKDEVGQKLEAEYEKLPANAKFEVTGLFDSLQKKIDSYMVNGTIPSAVQGKVDALQGLQRDLANIGIQVSEGGPLHTNGTRVFADVGNVRKLRQLLDTGKKDFSFTELDRAKKGAENYLTGAIRSEFGKQYPDIAKLNKEYSFWSKASQVLADTIERQTGQSGIVRKMGEGALGGLAGLPSGHPVIGSAIFAGLAELFNSPVRRTIGALAKSRLAKLLEKGDESGAQALIQQLLQRAPTGASRGAEAGTNALNIR